MSRALVITVALGLPIAVSAQETRPTARPQQPIELRTTESQAAELRAAEIQAAEVQTALPQDRIRLQEAIRRPDLVQEKVQLDTRQWEPVDTGAFTSRVAGTVVIPPDSLRVARLIRRDEVLRLEAPLAVIRQPGRTLSLDLSVDADPGLSCAMDGCEGTVQIGVIESQRPYDEIDLPTPMRIQLHGVDSVGPTPLTLRSTRVLQPVRVRSRTYEATLTVRPDGLPSIDVPLPLRTLDLQMSVASSSMDAWGLEKVPLDIAPIQGLRSGDTVLVRLQGEGLRVEPSAVRLTTATGATVELRSRGIGTGRVLALGPAYIEPADVQIDMVPPWLFFLFAVIGGTAGAFVPPYLKAASSRGPVAGRVVAGAVFGVLMATLTALGANVTSYPLPTGIVSEFLALAEAGLFAALAESILDKLSGAD